LFPLPLLLLVSFSWCEVFSAPLLPPSLLVPCWGAGVPPEPPVSVSPVPGAGVPPEPPVSVSPVPGGVVTGGVVPYNRKRPNIFGSGKTSSVIRDILLLSEDK